MPRLGQLLVRADLVSENNLARALGVQHFAGGRIGTLLLERGSVHEDDLGKVLAQQHGCEYVPWRLLADVPPVVIAALPAKFAIKHSAIPYDRSESAIKLALRDPADLRILDELFFVTGRKIIAAVAPEVRIYQALEKYYGERRTPRYAILAEKLSRPARGSRAGSSAPPPPPQFFPEPDRPSRPLPEPQEIWGDAADADLSAPPIVQTWKVREAPAGGWAGTSSPKGTRPSGEVEAIAWEEMPPSPSLWTSGAAVAPPSDAPAAAAPPTASAVAPPAAEAVPFFGMSPAAVPAATPPGPDAAAAPTSPARVPPEPPPEPVREEAVVPPPAPPPPDDGFAPPPDLFLAARPEPEEVPAPLPPAKTAPTGVPAANIPPPEPPVEPAPPPAAPPPAAPRAPIAPAGPPPAPAAPGRPVLPSAADFPEVSAAPDRDSIGAAVLAALARRFPRSALFAARPDAVAGWASAGEVDFETIRKVTIPWTDPSVFLNVRLSRSFYLGPLLQLPRHRELSAALGGWWPEECVVQPVLMKEKPVAFLFAIGSGEGITPMDLVYLRELAETASIAFASAIRLKKKEI